MTRTPQLTTVPGVSPLICASLRGQNGAAVTLKAMSIPSFMGLISSRHALVVELARGLTHSRPATGKRMAPGNAFSASRLGCASGAGLESEISAFLGERRSRVRQMDHWIVVLCWFSRIGRFG